MDNDEIIDEAEHKETTMREVCETNEDKEDAACVNDEGLFCGERWTEFLNYLIDEARNDQKNQDRILYTKTVINPNSLEHIVAKEKSDFGVCYC